MTDSRTGDEEKKTAVEESSLPAGGWRKEAGNEVIRLRVMKKANPKTKANLAMPSVLCTKETQRTSLVKQNFHK